MRKLHRADIQKLLKQKAPACISIFQPLTNQDYSTLREQLRHSLIIARSELNKYVDDSTKHSALAPAFRLLHDRKEMSTPDDARGIAVFVNAAGAQIYWLSDKPRQDVFVGKSFNLMPFLENHGNQKEYFIISLSRKQPRLLNADGSRVQQLASAGLPPSYEEFHVDKEHKTSNDIFSYLRAIDKGVTKYLNQRGKQNKLVIVVGLPHMVAAFMSLTKLQRRDVSSVITNPDPLTGQEILSKTSDVAQQWYARRRILPALRTLRRVITQQPEKLVVQADSILSAMKKGKVKAIFVNPDFDNSPQNGASLNELYSLAYERGISVFRSNRSLPNSAMMAGILA